jgi:zinc transporter, ZIP family
LKIGLAVSVSAASSEELGLTIAIAVAFHNGPEGMAIAAPYYAATNSRLGSIGLALLSGFSEPLGAIASLVVLGPFLQQHPWFIPYILCLVAGIMVASALVELLPEARSYGRSDLVMYGYCAGTLTMLLTIWVA